ncbi:MAG TPA: hypothetical protein VMZ66_07860 [Aeromicrobium sp.]|nr:hypothetical protein [Aeromicrobium sp.]
MARAVDVVRALLRAALIGVAVGIVARVLMRVVALLEGSDLGFDPGASVMIVGLFAVASVGACAGAMLFKRSRILGVIVTVVTAVPLWLPGSSIAIVEVMEHATGPAVEALGVVAVALLIGGCMVAAPVLGNRIGRRHTFSR